jgi:colicin import membrane protein
MKTRLFALGTLVLLLGAQAQQIAPSLPLDSGAERARIAADRVREQTRFEKEEAGCYQRFAVNDCLREVKVRRRAVLEELRRQEILLNEADRKKRMTEQIRRADERAAEQAQQDDADKRAAERQAYEERLKRAAQKKSSPGDKEPGQGAVAGPKVGASAAGAPSAESRAQDKKAFDEKQLKAQEHKAQRDKARAEKVGPPARHLPDPP